MLQTWENSSKRLPDPTSFHSGSRLLSITLVFFFSPVSSKEGNGERERERREEEVGSGL